LSQETKKPPFGLARALMTALVLASVAGPLQAAEQEARVLLLVGMDPNLELLGPLRERAISVPFILITAHDAPGLRQKAMSCGAVAYLAKPFRGTTLLEAVRAAT